MKDCLVLNNFKGDKVDLGVFRPKIEPNQFFLPTHILSFSCD